MAHTPGYDYDIFISYAHDDNALLHGDSGWVSQFCGLLSDWLSRSRGHKDLKIWFDQDQLHGNTRFDDAIKRSIESSALFFVIHSKNYQDSDYCNQELGWFADHNKRYCNGLRIGDESRLFNIQIENINHKQWSEKLAGTSGFVMHDAKATERGFPISPSDDQFNKPMRQIVEAAEKTLLALAPQSTAPEEETTQADDSTPTVFIANVPDTLKSFKKQLINEIGDKATILDDLPPPFPAAEHAKALQNTLAQSSLSIHLLDQYSGMEIIDASDGSTYSKVQADTARHAEQRSLIWVPETLTPSDIEESTHATWLNELENDKRDTNGFHFVRSTRQAFIDQVNQELDGLLAQGVNESALSKLLIDTHQKDQRPAYRLADILADRGIDVDFNKESSDPVKSLENFEQAVREVEHLIIMFGQVTPNWVGGRIQKAAKVIVEQMEHSDPILEAIWVFMLPRCPGKDSLPRIPKLFKLECLDNSMQEEIDESIIDTLLKTRGTAQ